MAVTEVKSESTESETSVHTDPSEVVMARRLVSMKGGWWLGRGIEAATVLSGGIIMLISFGRMMIDLMRQAEARRENKGDKNKRSGRDSFKAG
jgi:hypothetical protein